METNKFTASDKIIECIRTSKNLLHIRACRRMIRSFEYIYKDIHMTRVLVIELDEKREKIYKDLGITT